MSSPARSLKPRRPQTDHIHLPSVHIRRNGDGYDYDEDIFIKGHGSKRIAQRVVQFAAVEDDEVQFIRITTDTLCPEELGKFDEHLDFLMDEENPALIELMTERAKFEFERQMRIAAGTEQACAGCGCSQSRSCSGSCIWMTETLCSRCAR